MTRLLALFALLLTAAAPPSIPPELASSPQMVAAEHEAEQLLTPCNLSKVPPEGAVISLNDVCSQNQQFFVQQYVRALSGSWDDAFEEAEEYSQIDRAACDEKPGCKEVTASMWIGIPTDQTWACAWSGVAVALEKPKPWQLDFAKVYGHMPDTPARAELREQCVPLSMVELVRARDRAAAIIKRIADDPIHLPSPDWWLPWPTIEPFEGRP